MAPKRDYGWFVTYGPEDKTIAGPFMSGSSEAWNYLSKLAQRLSKREAWATYVNDDGTPYIVPGDTDYQFSVHFIPSGQQLDEGDAEPR